MSIAVSLQYVIKKNDKFINVLKIKTNYVNQITYLVLQIYIIVKAGLYQDPSTIKVTSIRFFQNFSNNFSQNLDIFLEIWVNLLIFVYN